MKAATLFRNHHASPVTLAAIGLMLVPGGSTADEFTSAAMNSTARQSNTAAPTRTITGGSVDGGEAVTTTMPSEPTSVITEDAPSGTTTTTADATPAPRRSSEDAAAGPKGGMVAPPVEYAAAPGPVWTVEAGYQSKYIWRGLDLVQMVSFNEIDLMTGAPYTLQRESSGVYYLGAAMEWNGLVVGAKYVRSESDDLNPLTDPSIANLDAYEEYILTLNYTMALAPDRWLDATLGFDFYYYPNEYFWGAEHQGLLYLNFNMPRYQWVQPHINFFYNVKTDSYTATGPNAPLVDLVSEGWGFNVGVSGGGQIAESGTVGFGISYGVDFLYKDGYAYEPSGFTHATATLAFPVTFGDNFTLTPSVSYVERFDTSGLFGSVLQADYYDDPGWWWGLKGTLTF